MTAPITRSVVDPPCPACGHLAAIRPCSHAGAPCAAPLDAAIATTAVALAIAVLAAQPHLPPWLAAWGYLVAIAIAAWIPGWVVAPVGAVGVVAPLLGWRCGSIDAATIASALAAAGVVALAIVVIRRARAQRDELVARRSAATAG